MEASLNPGRAITSAERLPGMMPAAGHLEHMPAHIMQRVGRYPRAPPRPTVRALRQTLPISRKTTPLDYYAMYTAHNYQFLAFSTSDAGSQGGHAGRDAKVARGHFGRRCCRRCPVPTGMCAELYTGMVRFGMWDELLAEAGAGCEAEPRLTAGYRYARTTALAAKGSVADAKAELAELREARGRGDRR